MAAAALALAGYSAAAAGCSAAGVAVAAGFAAAFAFVVVAADLPTHGLSKIWLVYLPLAAAAPFLAAFFGGIFVQKFNLNY